MDSTYKEHIRRFITENFLFGENGTNLNDDMSLIENGIIDSLGMLELVEFIESEYKVRVEDDEFIPENLDSLNRIVRFLKSKNDSFETS